MSSSAMSATEYAFGQMPESGTKIAKLGKSHNGFIANPSEQATRFFGVPVSHVEVISPLDIDFNGEYSFVCSADHKSWPFVWGDDRNGTGERKQFYLMKFSGVFVERLAFMWCFSQARDTGTKFNLWAIKNDDFPDVDTYDDFISKLYTVCHSFYHKGSEPVSVAIDVSAKSPVPVAAKAPVSINATNTVVNSRPVNPKVSFSEVASSAPDSKVAAQALDSKDDSQYPPLSPTKPDSKPASKMKSWTDDSDDESDNESANAPESANATASESASASPETFDAASKCNMSIEDAALPIAPTLGTMGGSIAPALSAKPSVEVVTEPEYSIRNGTVCKVSRKMRAKLEKTHELVYDELLEVEGLFWIPKGNA